MHQLVLKVAVKPCQHKNGSEKIDQAAIKGSHYLDCSNADDNDELFRIGNEPTIAVVGNLKLERLVEELVQQQVGQDEEDIDQANSAAKHVASLSAAQRISEERSAQQVGEKLESDACKHPHRLEEGKVGPVGSNGKEHDETVEGDYCYAEVGVEGRVEIDSFEDLLVEGGEGGDDEYAEDADFADVDEQQGEVVVAVEGILELHEQLHFKSLL